MANIFRSHKLEDGTTDQQFAAVNASGEVSTSDSNTLSKLTDIETNQTDKSQLTKITDGTEELAINASNEALVKDTDVETKLTAIETNQTDKTQYTRITDGTTDATVTTSNQLNVFNTDFYAEVAKGNVAKHSLVHKFGAGTVTTTLSPVTLSGFYRVPTAATALEVVSTSADDTNTAGSGAREVTITGLNSSWQEVTQTVNLNGTTAVALGTDLIRLYRWYVSVSGTYADQSNGSHVGTLTIQESGGGNVWSQLNTTPFPVGQSEIACYTVPTGYTAYLLSKSVSIDSNKTVDVFFFQRPNADDVSSPYSGTMRLIEKEIGVSGSIDFRMIAPKGRFVGPCDLGFMAVVGTGTADASAEFELLLIED